MRLEETVETLAKQHNRLERACEKKKGKEKLNTTDLASPTIKIASPLLGDDTQDVDLSDDDDDDLFEDAVSDFPVGGAAPLPAEGLGSDDYNRAFEDSSSLNDDSSVELQRPPIELSKQLEIKRSASEQVLLPKKDENTHRRWLSEDISTVRSLPCIKHRIS